MQKLRLGIDVGGTFTDVVAIDASTRTLVARVKVPTTHDAPEGVAAGIVAGIDRLLCESDVHPSDVAFIAHSTTQATNALLEGDVARVAVIGLLGASGWLARRQTRFSPVALAPQRWLSTQFAFADARDETAIRAAVDRSIESGAQAIAVTQAFGVDRPHAEALTVAYARDRGVDATCGHDVSAMYGLRARTRTAALNAAILPRMVRTSRMTAAAVERAAIVAPLMIMRSDGGVMDVREIERRPILTLLSGPAAGVAGALLHENLTEGIFIEVGGTSSDLSAIRSGRPQMHPAKIGGHRTMLRTLDVRTLGIAGGSMVRIGPAGVVDVGPRSAHIAGCAYAAFCAPEQLDGARVETIAPADGDPNDYAVLVGLSGERIAVTTTCAANALGTVPAGAFALGNATSARRAFELLAAHVGGVALALARSVAALAADKVRRTIEELIADYRIDPEQLVLVGGGGGAGSLVPFVGEAMQLPYRIARDAEVIAPIGVALALVREVVERTVLEPTAQDIARIRREAIDRIVAAGASPDRVEVAVEIDAQRNRVRATASGATALAEAVGTDAAGEAERRGAAELALHHSSGDLERVELTAALSAYAHADAICVVDRRAAVRLVVRGAKIVRTRAGDLQAQVRDAIERATRFGDVGRALPALYLARGERIATYEGLIGSAQAVALACEEVQGCDPAEPVVLITVARQA
ncbi:MAG TPA: hydantoinase/oxoprolinase family protein [Candidatus Baltobacteraceae bacterium]|nr:hydantoinase/oxoprolinase family protein [Candidatus Baltobacteraceae bacterium]